MRQFCRFTVFNAATANLADDTEALKHNFLLRGFFHRRGYFNLLSIDPDKYRTDPHVKRGSNDRTWISTEELFIHDSSGTEDLSIHGKAELNRAMAHYGDSILRSPIVVEGYSGAHDTADQFALSRIRANIVRRYLQSHFQLDQGSVGAVAMMSRPPDGLEHTSWDGVCILVFSGTRKTGQKDQAQERTQNTTNTAVSSGQN